MRTIESPGVQINEIDLSASTQLPVGTTVFCAGYASQGPTDELVNLTSIDDLQNIYGMPTNASERYFYQTCKEILNANGTLIVSRLPYGSGGGVGYTSTHNALVFPFYAWDSNTGNTTTATTTAGFVGTLTALSGATTYQGTYNLMQNASGASNNYQGINPAGTTSIIIGPSAAVLTLTNGLLSNGAINPNATLVSNNTAWSGTISVIDSDFDQFQFSITTLGVPLTTGNITINTQVLNAGGSYTNASFTSAESYYIGQPMHISVDDTTYTSWKQGGIQWQNQVPVGFTTSNFSNLSAVGYAGLVLVNDAKTTIDDTFEGYYIAIADNSRLDKGSNFNAITNVKSVNATTSNSSWVTLNTDRLAFALTGTYSQNAGNS